MGELRASRSTARSRTGGAGLTTALQRLIFGAAAIDGGDFESLATCRESLLTLWNLEFEIEEIRTAVEALERQGRCVRTRAGFTIRAEVMAELETRVAEASAVENAAFAEWEEMTRSKAPDLEDADFELLREDLELWLRHIVVRHGVEGALLLYPEDERARGVIDAIDAEGLRILPEREERLSEIREEALRAFVRGPTEAQRIYLANRLEAAFDLTVLTLDPAAERLARTQFNAHRVYLDTNFLYALLGFSPAQESLAAHRLVQLTRELGFELAITPWTVEELRTSLRRSRTNIEHISLPSRDYADLMVLAASEKGFDRAFWIAYRDSNMSREDFYDRAAHFEHDLERLGVRVVADGCKRVEGRAEELAGYVSLLDHVGGGRWKETVVLEHDAKHRILIEQLRGDGHLEFRNARYWFLTQDSRLPVFSRLRADGREELAGLPFCMTASAWAQIVRAFTPRTSDWDQMVVDLLASPYVGWKRGMSLPAVLEVVARVDQYADTSVDLAWEVLADTAKMAEIAELKRTGAPDERIAEVIDSTFVADAEEAKTRAQAARELQDEAEREADAERARAERLKIDLEEERGRRQGLESDLARLRHQNEEQARSVEERLIAMETRHDAEMAAAHRATSELQRSISDSTKTKRKHRRIAGAALIGLIGVLGPTILLLTRVVQGLTWDLVAVLGGVLLLSGAAFAALPDRWSSRLFVIAGTLLGVAALVIAIAAS